jgi:hypothetical protein
VAAAGAIASALSAEHKMSSSQTCPPPRTFLIAVVYGKPNRVVVILPGRGLPLRREHAGDAERMRPHTTEATPMVTPSALRALRVLCRPSARIA